uniref:Glycosyltransferase family 92 protein n=1 Tax=Sander lucioperca TaxID=283035 RepID=A0A8C9ZSE2_SANLU
MCICCYCRETCNFCGKTLQLSLTFFLMQLLRDKDCLSWQVTGTKTVLVAAYQEHRTEKKEVSEESRTPTQQLRISSGVSNIHSDHFGFAYGTANIMCPLPSGCETPSHIAVTSAAAFSEGTVGFNPFSLAVHPKATLVCICIHICLLGVNRVVVYKTSSSPETQRILDYYTNKGFVEVIPWSLSRFLNVSRGWLPEHGPGDIHYLGQIPALSDCVYRYMYQSRYVALHDMDELILPHWSELLPLLENKYGADKCYMFENNVFPITVTLRPPNSQPLPPQGCCLGWHNVSGVNILAHLYHEPIISETHYSNFKIIVNPRAVFIPTVHGLRGSQKGCSWVDRNIGVIIDVKAIVRSFFLPHEEF